MSAGAVIKIFKANSGLFALLKLQYWSAGDINLLIQCPGMDGRVGGERQAEPLIDFVTFMNQAVGSNAFVMTQDALLGPIRKRHSVAPKLNNVLQDAGMIEWLRLTQMLNGSGTNEYGKCKYFYKISIFSDMEIALFGDTLTRRKMLSSNRHCRRLILMEAT